ncbi:major facilitator superfamily protein, partial [Kipferlia bialata]
VPYALSLYLIDTFGVSELQYSFITSTMGVFSIFSPTVLGLLSAKYGLVVLLRVCGVVFTLSVCLLAGSALLPTPSWTMLCVSRALLGMVGDSYIASLESLVLVLFKGHSSALQQGMWAAFIGIARLSSAGTYRYMPTLTDTLGLIPSLNMTALAGVLGALFVGIASKMWSTVQAETRAREGVESVLGSVQSVDVSHLDMVDGDVISDGSSSDVPVVHDMVCQPMGTTPSPTASEAEVGWADLEELGAQEAETEDGGAESEGEGRERAGRGGGHDTIQSDANVLVGVSAALEDLERAGKDVRSESAVPPTIRARVSAALSPLQSLSFQSYMLCLSIAGTFAAFYTFSTFGPLLMVEFQGLADDEAAQVLVPAFLANAVGNVLPLIMPRRYLVLWALVFSVLGVLGDAVFCFGETLPLWIISITLVCKGLGFASGSLALPLLERYHPINTSTRTYVFASPSVYALTPRVCPPSLLPLSMMLGYSGFNLAMTINSVAGGALFDSHPTSVPIIICVESGVALCATYLAVFACDREQKRIFGEYEEGEQGESV